MNSRQFSLRRCLEIVAFVSVLMGVCATGRIVWLIGPVTIGTLIGFTRSRLCGENGVWSGVITGSIAHIIVCFALVVLDLSIFLLVSNDWLPFVRIFVPFGLLYSLFLCKVMLLYVELFPDITVTGGQD